MEKVEPMSDFFKRIAGILEVDNISEGDDLKAFAQWDSLSVLSVIAMLDANYGVNLRAADLGGIKSAGDLWNLVQSSKAPV
jgi:acyl carrier protein